MDLTDTNRTPTSTAGSCPTSTGTPRSTSTLTSTLTLSELLAELGVADDEALPQFWD